jgi:predicted RNase H-like HicB family nuclease
LSSEFRARIGAEKILVRPKRKFTIVIERDEEGYYVATVPALRGCHTQAKNLDVLMKRAREVIALCLESDGGEARSLELVDVQQISV